MKEYEAAVKRRVQMLCIRFYLSDEDSIEDEIDEVMFAELDKIKSSRYLFHRSYRKWNSNWEQMLHDDMYMNDEEFLSNVQINKECVRQLNDRIKDDDVFGSIIGKMPKRSSTLHIMELLKFLGCYGNDGSMQKIGCMMGISKGLVRDYIT